MTVKQDLHRLIDLVPDEEAAEVLDYLQWLMRDGDTLSETELEMLARGEDEIARGEFVTLDDFDRSVGR